MLGFWYNDLTRAQDGFKVALVELRDADIYYVYSLADFSYYCGYSLVAVGLGIDRNLVLDYGRTSAWRLNFKNQTYPSNPGVNPGLIIPKTKTSYFFLLVGDNAIIFILKFDYFLSIWKNILFIFQE